MEQQSDNFHKLQANYTMTPTPTLKTREEVLKQFDRTGTSVAGWCRANECNPKLTYQILRGLKQGKRGQSHRIAVLLGIKDGVVV